MARLINADTLIAWIKDSQQMTSKMKAIICYIKTMPTIEAVSVMHGTWEEKEIFCIDDDPIIEQWQSARCSMCERYHTTPYMYYFTDYNYCPYCGADMREHKESE